MTSTIWVCVDCLATEANGQASDDPDYTPDREPLSLLDGVEYTIGLTADEHAPDCDALETGGECDCAQREFSWSPCEGCGSTLGGAREAFTVWDKADA